MHPFYLKKLQMMPNYFLFCPMSLLWATWTMCRQCVWRTDIWNYVRPLRQLPPRFDLNLERLECFLKQAPRQYRWAIEFRDSRWLVDDVYALLRSYNACLVIHDHEDIPSLHPQVCISYTFRSFSVSLKCQIKPQASFGWSYCLTTFCLLFWFYYLTSRW